MAGDTRNNRARPRRICLRTTILLLATAACLGVANAQEPRPVRIGAAFDAASGFLRTTREYGWLRVRRVESSLNKPTLRPDHIDQGKDDDAIGHYGEIARVLGAAGSSEFDSLDKLLAIAGYDGLTAGAIANLESAVLMNPQSLQEALGVPVSRLNDVGTDDVLTTRFFSPKTTDVSRRVSPTAYSWRRIVRLRVRQGSVAETRGVQNLWILTNVYEPDLEKDPFQAERSNFQAILQMTIDLDNPRDRIRPPLFFLVFGPAPKASLVFKSTTSWDAGNENQEGINADYHPPVSCIQCHGKDTKFGRLQYLDSDHWLDRVKEDDDFAAVGKSRWPALYDAGNDPDSPRFAAAFDVLRKLNHEILRQNEAIDRSTAVQAVPNPAEFQTRAAARWLELHRESNSHFPPPERGLLGRDGKTRWNPENPFESQLTVLLNRFCFRCHSSVAYHVMDKQTVLSKRDDFSYHLIEAKDFDSMRMPQDRLLEDPVFTNATRHKILDLLDRLQVPARSFARAGGSRTP
jgi:hypothetical protein